MIKIIALTLSAAAVFVGFPQKVETPTTTAQVVQEAKFIQNIEVIPLVPKLTHEQEVWLYALEWCESRGVKTAINPQDNDGTPSYYSFQFKPDTFTNYGIKYGLIESTTSPETLRERLKSYKDQRDIVTHMIHDKSVNWHQQFPDCVRRNGLPPR